MKPKAQKAPVPILPPINPFAQVRMKLQEHYGFEIGESTIQRIALGHAKNIFEASRVIPDFPETLGKHKDIIAETDGGMVPIVEPDPARRTSAKARRCRGERPRFPWRTPKGAQRRFTRVAIEVGVETAGRQLFECAVRAGFGANSRVHVVGDGAPWIVGPKWRSSLAPRAAT
jgi:hypothetical protein